MCYFAVGFDAIFVDDACKEFEQIAKIFRNVMWNFPPYLAVILSWLKTDTVIELWLSRCCWTERYGFASWYDTDVPTVCHWLNTGDNCIYACRNGRLVIVCYAGSQYSTFNVGYVEDVNSH